MAKRYKIYPIKTIKDWQDEDWDVYEERNTQTGVMIYKGWMYERIVKSQYIFILTDGLAEFLKKYDLAKSMKLLGLLIKIITRFRCAFGLQKNMSIQYSIKEIAIGLNKTEQEILTARSYLKELLGEKKRVPLLNWVRTPNRN